MIFKIQDTDGQITFRDDAQRAHATLASELVKAPLVAVERLYPALKGGELAPAGWESGEHPLRRALQQHMTTNGHVFARRDFGGGYDDQRRPEFIDWREPADQFVRAKWHRLLSRARSHFFGVRHRMWRGELTADELAGGEASFTIEPTS